MRARFVLPIVAVIVAHCFGVTAQQQPVRVNPTPTQPTAPTAPSRPAPSQQNVVVRPVGPVTPVAEPMNAQAIRAVAIQSNPPAGATPAEQAELRQVAELAKKGDFGGMNEKWLRSVNGAAKRDKRYQEWIELESWNNYVLHQAYIAPDPELNRAADKIRFYDAQQDAARARRNELTQAKASVVQPTTQTLTVRRLNLSENYDPNWFGNQLGGPAPTEQIPRGSVDEEIRKVDTQLSRLGDDAQLANVDLQNKLQKQQQILQTMSNVSKMLHDTAMSVIRKIGS